MLGASILVAFVWLLVAWQVAAQCPPELPVDSICSDGSWLVNQTYFSVIDSLDVSQAAVNFTGSYLQLPNATLTIDWSRDASGELFIAGDALLSGKLVVRFIKEPSKGAHITVVTAGHIVGAFQEFIVEKNYTKSGCDDLHLDQAETTTTTTLIITVSKSNACFTEKHIPLIVVCIASGVVILGVIAYLIVTECNAQLRRRLLWGV